MISVENAIKLISKTTPRNSIETINLEDASNRILAQNIESERDQPPFNRVAMDGIGLSTKSTGTLFSIEAIQAAGSPQLTLNNTENCIEVMTGAILPKNCDCVIPYERVSIENGKATIKAEDIKKYGNIHKRAIDYRANEIILNKDIIITSPVMAVISSQGLSSVYVYQQPSIAIVSTGSELVEMDEAIEEYQIRLSNSYTLKSELVSCGYKDIQRFHIVDDEEKTIDQIKSILNDFDILILSGGVSMGKFDFIPEALDGLGVTKHFHKITQKPGKPMWYGTLNTKQIFALPGNPVSCLVCLKRYVVPSLSLRSNIETKQQFVTLAEDINFKRQFTLFKSVTTKYRADGIHLATATKGNGSGDFYSMATSTGFVELPADKEVFKAGEVYPYYQWS